TRRPRFDVGSRDHALRQQHEQQQRAQSLSLAFGDHRRRQRKDQRQSALEVCGADAALESAADVGPKSRYPCRESRRRRHEGVLGGLKMRARIWMLLSLVVFLAGTLIAKTDGTTPLHWAVQ